MDAVSLKLARNYTNEKLNSLPSNRPTKTVSFDGGIYSVGNDVVNGQVSVTLKGQTRTNIAPTTVEDWEQGGFANTTVGSNHTLVGSDTIIRMIALKPITSNKQFTASLANGYEFRLLGVDSSNIITEGYGWTNKVTFTTKAQTETYRIAIRKTSLEAITPSEIMNAKMLLEAGDTVGTYISSGTKSTLSHVVKSVGKNLFDGELVVGEQISGSTGLVFNSSTAYRSEYIDVVPGETYTISGFNDSVTSITLWYDANKNFISRTTSGKKDKETFTLPTNARYVRFTQYQYASSDAVISDVEIRRNIIQLEPGTTATECEPHKNNIVYINTGGELRSLPNSTNDEVSVITGKATKNIGEDIPLEDKNWSYHTSTTTNFWGTITPVTIPDEIKNIYVRNYGGNASPNYSVFASSDKKTYYYNGTSLLVKVPKSEIVIAGDVPTNAELTSWFASKQYALTYQLATPIVTKLPAQAPLQVFENGTVYVEPIGDPAESTVPSVEMTIPTGNSNQLGVAEHDFKAAAADWVLTSNEGKCGLLKPANAGDAVNIVAPAKPRCYLVENLTGQNVTVKTATSAGVTIAADTIKAVAFNGEDYKEVL